MSGREGGTLSLLTVMCCTALEQWSDRGSSVLDSYLVQLCIAGTWYAVHKQVPLVPCHDPVVETVES